MILLDTNIFVIDRFFPRDARYSLNKQLVDKLPELDAAFSIFSLSEQLFAPEEYLVTLDKTE